MLTLHRSRLQVFEEVDTNHDGIVGSDELYKAFTNMGVHLNPQVRIRHPSDTV